MPHKIQVREINLSAKWKRDSRNIAHQAVTFVVGSTEAFKWTQYVEISIENGEVGNDFGHGNWCNAIYYGCLLCTGFSMFVLYIYVYRFVFYVNQVSIYLLFTLFKPYMWLLNLYISGIFMKLCMNVVNNAWMQSLEVYELNKRLFNTLFYTT